MKLKNPVSQFKQNLDSKIRESAINAARSRIILAGLKAESLSPEELEIIVKEEEDKIKSKIKEKGLFAMAAALGLGWWI
ncbi:hypothetical protein [Catenovulum maritimum]|uniref:Uncharacterized protein n=1 Tax=Catenovulum maritimum TaxID=1513271 RepID=A0A0J8JP86_9ALTE|nr:hypothetical protein [Catenovulum maritimum]KMT66461.1 hypothetical protein XM47_02650 [Catenovulum maritimum]